MRQALFCTYKKIEYTLKMNEQIKNNRGRPLGTTAEKTASKVFQLRVEPDQLEAYKAASKREGKSLSKWARDLMDEASK